MTQYAIFSIQTAPIQLQDFFELSEEEQMKKINPLDSRIISIGVLYKGNVSIFSKGPESDIIADFWSFFKNTISASTQLVGFNAKQFEIPFIVTRSFILNVNVPPFSLKNILDLREHIHAFRFGQTRGKLREFGQVLGVPSKEIEAKDIVKLHFSKEQEKLSELLLYDITITQKILTRLVETGIIHISRF